MTPIDLAELARRLSNLIRYGQVAEIDYAQALARVECDGYLTGWLPWLTRRAGTDVSWWAPEVGEAVLVLAPDGDPSLATILSAAYSDDVPPPESRADIAAFLFGNSVAVSVDRSTGAVTITSSGIVRVQAERIELDAPDVEITGRLSVGNGATVTGDVTADGVSLKTHVHSDVQSGSADSGPPK